VYAPSVAYDAAAASLLAAMRERKIEVSAALLRCRRELGAPGASFESGLVPQSTVLQQRALVASTRAQLVQARQAWLEQLLALKALLLLPASEDLRLATPGDAELDALVAVARPAPPPAQRPDVAAQRLRVEAAEAAVDEADAADRPTLS
jgi:outer membrane protein TolC